MQSEHSSMIIIDRFNMDLIAIVLFKCHEAMQVLTFYQLW